VAARQLEETVAKGQLKGNKEAKKPKAPTAVDLARHLNFCFGAATTVSGMAVSGAKQPLTFSRLNLGKPPSAQQAPRLFGNLWPLLRSDLYRCPIRCAKRRLEFAASDSQKLP
jgi:hypothetical protein